MPEVRRRAGWFGDGYDDTAMVRARLSGQLRVRLSEQDACVSGERVGGGQGRRD